jgi:protein arginine N-methyltransferase 5
MEVGDRLPSEPELTRWLGEPIKTLLIPTSIFLTNKKGYPVLSRPYQAGGFPHHVF